MPRYARKQSSSGVYHVMLRGNNRQQIFYDEEDCVQFLRCLYDCKQISRFRLYAYCLMGNHVHLLINAKNEPIDLIMKRLGSKYVYWYNAKYDRVGHLFQDRFKSEPVETDSYFLAVLRYIHHNPVKSGIVRNPESYDWSSYGEYMGEPWLVDTKLALRMLEGEFVQWHEEYNEDVFLDVEEKPRHTLTDERVAEILCKASHCGNLTEFERLSENIRIQSVKEAYAEGASIRQIGRLIGCSKSRVERWLGRKL